MKENKEIFEHPEDLLSEFDDADYEKWHDIAVKSLKGKPFDKIIKKVLEGFEIHPIYNRSDAEKCTDPNSMPGYYPYGRGSKSDGYILKKWHIAQEIPYPTPNLLNSALKKDLSKGQTSISIIYDYLSKKGLNPASSGDIFKNGTSIFSSEDIKKIFDGIDIKNTPVYLDAGLASLAHFSLFADYMNKENHDLNELTGGLFFDPIALSLNPVYDNVNIDLLYEELSTFLAWKISNMPNFRALSVDSSIYHESGCDAVQEVAFSIATGTHHLRLLQKNDMKVDTIANNIMFNVAFGPAFFIEISKMRALRKLWAKIVSEFGGSKESSMLYLYARTSELNKSKLDFYVNMIRNTTEALSAIFSGANAIHVGYFDGRFGIPNEFSRRFSRNTQLVLMEECNIPDVIDPVGGTWYIEKLTDEIAKRSWDLFLEIEKLGGMRKAIEEGFVQDKIEEKADKRINDLALRKDILVGTNKYPNNNEKSAKPLEIDFKELAYERTEEVKNHEYSTNDGDDRIKDFSAILDLASKKKTLQEIFNIIYEEEPNNIEPLKKLDLSEKFEKLRKYSDDYYKKNGKKPDVYLANIGTVKDYKARADFSYDFFSVGGFEVISNIGTEKWEEAAKAAIESDCKVITICSTDDKYTDFVPQFARLIKRAKPMTYLVLAGLPKAHINEFKSAGIDDFIHIKSNIVDSLNEIIEKIGL